VKTFTFPGSAALWAVSFQAFWLIKLGEVPKQVRDKLQIGDYNFLSRRRVLLSPEASLRFIQNGFTLIT
jgi:hypothetical protein